MSIEGLVVKGFLPARNLELVHQQAEKTAGIIRYAVGKVALIDVSRAVLGDNFGKRYVFSVGKVHNAEIIADSA